MQELQPAKLLRLHVSEGDRWNGKPLYQAVVDKCRDLGIAGVTVFRALEGFGESAEMHRSHWIARDQPILVSVVETEANVRRLVPELESMIDTGMITISDVQVVRIRNSHDF